MFDIQRLRQDLMDYFGTGACSGMPAMFFEVMDIQSMSAESLIELAESNGFDLADYID